MLLTKATIVSLIICYSNLLGFDANVALAVATVESGLNPNAIGKKGEIGLFQVMPQYVKGFTKKQLLDPTVNVIVGIKRLKEEQAVCSHKDGINYLVCYNYGRKNAKKVKHPTLFPYVVKVKKQIKEGVMYGQNQVCIGKRKSSCFKASAVGTGSFSYSDRTNYGRCF